MNKGVYFASFTAILWGFLAIALKISLDDLPPVTVTWFRFLIAFCTLSLYYAIFDRPKLKIFTNPPRLALLAGVFLGCNYLGFISGINLTTPSIAQIFIQTGPVILAIAGIVIFKEKINIRQGMGLLIVVFGLLIFYNEQILNVAGGLKNYKLGVLYVLFGAFSWAGYAIVQKFAVTTHNPMQLNLIIFGLPALAYTPFVAFEKIPALDLNDWLLLIFLGLNTLGAYGSLAYALKYLEANKISVIVTLNPMITFVTMAMLATLEVNWIKLEVYTIVTIIGALTVLFGVMLTVIKKRKKLST